MKTARLDCKIELAGAFWQGGPLRPDAVTCPLEGLERHRFEGLELQGEGVGQRVTDGAPANWVHGRQRGDADPAARLIGAGDFLPLVCRHD